MFKIANWSQFQNSNSLLESSPDDSFRAFKKMQFCRMQVVKNNPFFGHLAMKLVFEERMDLPYKTMATDGNNLYYDRDFALRLSSPEVEWVIIHEVMHCALFHFTRKMPDPRIWNAACDYALNYLIDPSNPSNKDQAGKLGKMPSGCLRDDKFNGMRAEQIYQFLIENSVVLPPEAGWNYGAVTPPPPIGGRGGGSGGGTSTLPKVKIGDFISDNSGSYGEVIAIDGETGDVDINPMTKDEIKTKIESASGRKVIKIV